MSSNLLNIPRLLRWPALVIIVNSECSECSRALIRLGLDYSILYTHHQVSQYETDTRSISLGTATAKIVMYNVYV